MVEVGQFNTLRVVKEVPFGLYLDGDDWGEILLPSKFVPSGSKVGDELVVFLYFDSEDKIIATTQRPRAQMGSCAYLKVIDINRVGAFLDWGLDKDLLVPKPEQRRPMEKGKSYIVYLKQDGEGRIVASSKYDRFLDKWRCRLMPGDEVSLLIAETSDLGHKVIVNDSYWGLVHFDDVFQELRYGKRMRGYIKKVRDDGKLDVLLSKTGSDKISDLGGCILAELHKKGGFLPLHDKSSADEIKRVLGESKKSFKRAIGHLYKQNLITLDADGIRLVKGAER
ncbi:S1 RNA binding domain [hydrothermal vent metagenome]|uniref:S1 RNA binding domain n=1 Tax=hydrothermal vent metagenome TaxID=652676 RepID=A0A3B0ZBV0_9ZZZZ